MKRAQRHLDTVATSPIVEFGVRVLRDDEVVNTSEDCGHPLRARRRRGEEGQLLAALLEGAVGHETMEMTVKAEVACGSAGPR